MKIFEKVKDILYDSIDYVIMLTIVLVVVFVIGWRLDVLFAKDAFEDKDNNTVIVDNSNRPDPNIHKDEAPDNEEIENPEEPNKSTEPTTPNKEPKPTTPTEPAPPANNNAEFVKIQIPDGTLPGKIGTILENNGLVTSGKDFVAKAVEMKLETKLKSGSYSIQKGSSLEQVVKIIAKR